MQYIEWQYSACLEFESPIQFVLWLSISQWFYRRMEASDYFIVSFGLGMPEQFHNESHMYFCLYITVKASPLSFLKNCVGSLWLTFHSVNKQVALYLLWKEALGLTRLRIMYSVSQQISFECPLCTRHLFRSLSYINKWNRWTLLPLWSLYSNVSVGKADNK